MEEHWLSDEEIDGLGKAQWKGSDSDPVKKYNDKWYFWDETWTGCFGPFATKKEAREACKQYAQGL